MAKAVNNYFCSGFIYIITVVLLVNPFSLDAQQKRIPLLERTISVSLNDVPLDEALKKIGSAGSFTFSYKSSLLDKNERVTFDFVNKTVREILDQLFKGSIDYKERGKYIILIRASKPTSKEPSVLSGYVIDEATGQRLGNVSIYDPVSLSSTVTDSYGYFKIEIKNPTGEEVKLAINKKQYTDTLVVVPKGNKRLLKILINIDKDKITTLADSVSERLKRFWLATKAATEQAINMENISDTMYRMSQFSLVPFVGTNGKLSGNVINDYSLNLLGGHSLGNRKIEVAGLFNTTRGNVTGFQSAGLFNVTGGTQHGVQLAGLANATLDSTSGIQLAGLVNINVLSTNGVRGAGLVNFILGNSTATQFSGLGNIVIGEQRRPQLSGLFNFATGDVGPAQVAGLFNFTAKGMRGAQIGGLFNIATKDVQGVQISGIFNVAPKSMKGVQLGLMNIGNSFQGTQIGFINVSNRMKGVPVGFLSVVGKGYHKLEFSADEIFYTNISFRTGVHQFYNILTVGAKPDSFKEDNTLWSFGYGVGTAPKIKEWLYLNFDVTSSQIVQGNEIEKINLLNKIYGGFDFQLAKNFSITAGVTLNGHLTDSTYDAYPEIFTDYVPEIIRERNFSNDLNLKMWWGAKAGIRFF